MVILRYGGVYADVDTQCGRPLDNCILPTDSFVTGWEDEYATAELAVKFKFARQRQLQQWVFAAEPGHPALQVGNLWSSWIVAMTLKWLEKGRLKLLNFCSAVQALCERVAASAFQPYSNSITDALFRTGPGPFTDEVLRHAMKQQHGSGYSVRILPRVTLGGLPGGEHGVGLWQETSTSGSTPAHGILEVTLLQEEGTASDGWAESDGTAPCSFQGRAAAEAVPSQRCSTSAIHCDDSSERARPCSGKSQLVWWLMVYQHRPVFLHRDTYQCA